MYNINFLAIIIAHAGHRHAVVVIKEAHAQVHELKSNVSQPLLVLNNGCSIYGMIVNRTLLNIVCRLYSVTFIE